MATSRAAGSGALAASARYRPCRRAVGVVMGVPGRFLAALLALLLSAAAQAQDLPALYSVSGIPAPDTLNVRERPEAGAPLRGRLAADAVDVEVTGLSPEGSWARVNLDDRVGWVALRFLARQPGPDWRSAGAELFCYGTEPSWRLDLAAGEARFDSPAGPEPPRPVTLRASLPAAVERGAAEEGAEPGAAGTEGGPGLLGLRFGDSFAAIRARSCGDGTSERVNGLEIALFHTTAEGTVALSGCCALTP